MASQALPVEIVTPARLLFSSQATEVVLPAFDGQVGILPGHADFMGKMGVGVLKIAYDERKSFLAVAGGVYHVSNGILTVMCQVGEGKNDIEIEDTKASAKQLEQQLATFNRAAEDPTKLEQQYALELARIEVATKE